MFTLDRYTSTRSATLYFDFGNESAQLYCRTFLISETRMNQVRLRDWLLCSVYAEPIWVGVVFIVSRMDERDFLLTHYLSEPLFSFTEGMRNWAPPATPSFADYY